MDIFQIQKSYSVPQKTYRPCMVLHMLIWFQNKGKHSSNSSSIFFLKQWGKYRRFSSPRDTSVVKINQNWKKWIFKDINMDNSIILYGAKVYSVCIVVTKTPKSSSFKHRRQLNPQFKSFGSSLNSNTQVQFSTQLMKQLTTACVTWT